MYIKCKSIVISSANDTIVTDCCINVSQCKDFYRYEDSVVFRMPGAEYTIRLGNEEEAATFYKKVIYGIEDGVPFVEPSSESGQLMNLYIV